MNYPHSLYFGAEIFSIFISLGNPCLGRWVGILSGTEGTAKFPDGSSWMTGKFGNKREFCRAAASPPLRLLWTPNPSAALLGGLDCLEKSQSLFVCVLSRYPSDIPTLISPNLLLEWKAENLGWELISIFPFTFPPSIPELLQKYSLENIPVGGGIHPHGSLELNSCFFPKLAPSGGEVVLTPHSHPGPPRTVQSAILELWTHEKFKNDEKFFRWQRKRENIPWSEDFP